MAEERDLVLREDQARALLEHHDLVLAEGKCSPEETGRRPDAGRGDSQGSVQGNLVSPERRRRTVQSVRSRVGPLRAVAAMTVQWSRRRGVVFAASGRVNRY